MAEGLRVLRGPNWLAGDHDGGEGHLGTVASLGGEGTCEVLWDNGNRGLYRIGKLKKFDLRIFDNASVGVKHADIFCDGCEITGISGMRWTCAQCKKCNLCPLCYVSDIHDLSHEFVRVDKPGAQGVRLKKRAACVKIRAMGLFPGAKVKRGPNWNSGNTDGGAQNVGEVVAVENSLSTPSTRNVVSVRWPSGHVSKHRVGLDGKVEVQYVEESQGTYYYRDHLPCLDADNFKERPTAAATTTATATTAGRKEEESTALREGDKACIHVTAATLKSMQESKSGWSAGMANCIGKIGIIKSFTPSGEATVEFGGLRYRLCRSALKKVSSFAVGDTVKIDEKEEIVKMLQQDHGGFSPGMIQLLGKCGKVVEVQPDGDVYVSFGEKRLRFHPACCTSAVGQRLYEITATASAATSSAATTSSSRPEPEPAVDLFNFLATLVLKDALTLGLTKDLHDLFEAIGRGDLARVTFALGRSPKLLNVKHEGLTPLILAAHGGQTDIVKLLLDKGAELEFTDQKGHTALQAAIIGRKPQTALLLIQRGSSVTTTNNQKRSCLHFAAHADVWGVIGDLIRKGCDVNAKDDNSDTALHNAIARGNNDATRMLLRAAKLDLTVTNAKGFCPLHLCCFAGNSFATEELLKRDASTANRGTDKEAVTPLHIAAVNNQNECAKLLIEVGKSNVNAKSKDQLTALHFACNELHQGMVRFLLSKGADPNNKDSDGDTPLHMVMGGRSQGGEVQLFAALFGLPVRSDDEERVRLAVLLVQNNAKVDIRNNNGDTPLGVAKSPAVRDAVLRFARQSGQSSSSPRGAQGRTVEQVFNIPLPCRTCMERPADITVLPCEHNVLCRSCCLQVQRCPVCKLPIQRRLAKKGDLRDPCQVQ